MRLTLAPALVALSMAFGAPAQADPLDLDTMSTADREAFRREVRSYLLENPEVIFEAIQILEERRTMAGQQADQQLIAQHAQAIFEDGFSYVAGNPDGDITVVEFLDYRCGYCKKAHPEVQQLLEADPNIRLVVKEFPILGPDSVKAGKIALAALDLDPSNYKTLNDEMMAYRGNLTEQVAYQIAGNVGYDIAALKERAASTEVDDRLNQNYQLAQALGLQGTPAFIVGNEIIRGYLPFEDMLGSVKDARAALN